MNRECLKIKCPVCGRANEPTVVDVEQGWEMKVRAKYECHNIRKRLFRARNLCETKYTIEWTGTEAWRKIVELGKEGKA